MMGSAWKRASRRVILGCSIGTWNALLLGAERFEDARALWRGITGLDDVLRTQIDVWNGLKSMKPARKILEAADAGKGLLCDVYAGTVDIAEKRQIAYYLNNLGRKAKQQLAECSGSQPFLMENVDFQGAGYFDGGAGGWVLSGLDAEVRPKRAAPPLPKPEEVAEYHAILCSPRPGGRNKPRTQEDIKTAPKRAMVAFELLLDMAVVHNIDTIRHYKMAGPKYLYAPESWEMCGAPDDFSPETIERRLTSVADWMWDNRCELGTT